MGEVKQTNIKNRIYYFYNDIIDIKNFDASLLKIDKKSFKSIDIYNIGYVKVKKDYMKIKFNSDDNLRLNKPLKFHNMTITSRCVFSEGGKLYWQVFLDDALYELNI